MTKLEGMRKSGVWDEAYGADRPQTTQRLAGLLTDFGLFFLEQEAIRGL